MQTETLKLHISDPAGRPVAKQEVSLRLERHAFLFGCNLYGLDLADGSDRQHAYRQRFTEVFNFATLPFYWGGYEREPGHEDRGRLTAMATWAREHGLVTKGHPLVWHEVVPGWAPTDPDAVEPMLRERVERILGDFGGLVPLWDVLNEAQAAAKFPGNGVSAWIAREGTVGAVRKAMHWARAAAAPGSVLLYNDYDNGNAAFAILEALAEHGELPDAIGLQSHMHGNDWDLEELAAILDRFAAFNRPLHLTEITVVSGVNHRWWEGGPLQPWPSTPGGEARQAAYVEALYSLIANHPAVEAATWWDFCDHRAWLGAPAGLLREDGSPKPAFEVLRNLIWSEWRTEATVITDAGGHAQLEGRAGTYTWQAGGHRGSVRLSGGAAATVTL